MTELIRRFLAAIGVGGHKTEADVSYDPALDDNAAGGEPGPGGSDLKKKKTRTKDTPRR
jgi:hypothetical protein